MKKLLFPFIMFVFASNSIYSQNQDSVKYKILEDDPSNLPNLHLFLSPYAEFFKANSVSVGWSLGGNLLINRIYGDFSLFNSMFSDKKEQLWNIGGGYVLGDNTYTSETKVKVAESRHKTNFWTGNQTWTEWYVYPHLTHRDIYMVRGGMFIYNLHELYYSHDYYNGYSHQTKVESKNNYPSIYGGFSMQMIDNSVVQIENGRRVKMKDIYNLYADILLGMIKKTDDNGNEIDRNSFGFRIGMEYRKIKKVNAFCAKLELGIRPGIKKEGFFIALNIYLPMVNINTNGSTNNTINNTKTPNF